MKKKKLFIVFVLMSCVFGKTTAIESPALLAAILSESITSLNSLYEMYDHTMNQIEMIKQKYEQMQFYIDRAANWNWDEVQWDGDLDFRNEIRSATSQVDKQLTNIRKIKNSLTNNTLSFGGVSYSVASLAGVKIDGQGNLFDYIKNGTEYYSDGFKSAAKVWAEGVSDEDAAYIWSKYGLTPANYKMVRDVENKLNESISYLIGNIEESTEKKEIETQQMEIIENIMNMLTQEGATPDEIASVNAMLQEQTVFSLKGIEQKLEQCMGYMAWQQVLQNQKEEAEKQSAIERMNEMMENSVSSYF